MSVFSAVFGWARLFGAACNFASLATFTAAVIVNLEKVERNLQGLVRPALACAQLEEIGGFRMRSVHNYSDKIDLQMSQLHAFTTTLFASRHVFPLAARPNASLPQPYSGV